MHVCDIAIFKDNTEEWEFLIKILDHLTSHISFQIKNLRQPNAIDEISDALVYFCIEELIKASCSKTIDKVFDFLWTTRHTEREIEVNTNVGIILGWAVMDWSIIVDYGLSEHACDPLSAAIAPLSTWLHNACASSTALFQSG